jgi:L-ascorbate metabolism protein UlaG (beta-lactamase superfamily)
VRWIYATISISVAAILSWFFLHRNDCPRPWDFREIWANRNTPPPATFNATFFGVSTLLFDDGRTRIMIDGFFTRPPLSSLFSVSPDQTVIDGALAQAGIPLATGTATPKLSAIIVNHSHYDHALDAPTVAQRTGAHIYGSSSTAHVASGGGVPPERIHTFSGNENYCFGRFSVTLLRSQHGPPVLASGDITEDITPPRPASAYKEGGTFSILIRNGSRRALVQGSAGFVAGALAGRQADVVFLGVGGLGGQTATQREDYWREVVEAVGARRVVPIHWDDFLRPLSQGLVASSDFDTGGGRDFVTQRAQQGNIDVRMPDAFVSFDPFQGL